jgi:hypothetical protein
MRRRQTNIHNISYKRVYPVLSWSLEDLEETSTSDSLEEPTYMYIDAIDLIEKNILPRAGAT